MLSTFSTLFLSLIAIGAQNVRFYFISFSRYFLLIQVLQAPIPGTYFIVNSVPSSAGDMLAATFQDVQQDVTVTPGPLSSSETQRVWLDTSIHNLLSISLDFVLVDHIRH